MDTFIDKLTQRKNAQEMIKANAMAEAKEREKLAEKLSEHELALQEMRRCNLQNLENAERVRELLAASLLRIEEAPGRDGQNQEWTEEALRKLLEELAGKITKLMDEQQARTAGLLERQQDWMAEFLERQQGWMTGLLEKQQVRTAELLEAQKERTAKALERQQARMEELLTAQKERTVEALGGQQARVEELLTAQKEQATEALQKQQLQMEKLLEEQKKEVEEFAHKEAVKVYRNVQAVLEGALPKQTAEIVDALKASPDEKGSAPKGLVALGILTFLAAAGSVAIEVLRMLGYV